MPTQRIENQSIETRLRYTITNTNRANPTHYGAFPSESAATALLSTIAIEHDVPEEQLRVLDLNETGGGGVLIVYHTIQHEVPVRTGTLAGNLHYTDDDEYELQKGDVLIRFTTHQQLDRWLESGHQSRNDLSVIVISGGEGSTLGEFSDTNYVSLILKAQATTE